MKNLMVGVLRILICVAIGVELIGCFCINSIMFHPVRHYDASYPVEGADHNDLIGVLGLYEYKKLLLKMAKIGT